MRAQDAQTKPLPQDPKAILDLAAPLYNYDASNAKPWHLSYHYRVLDDQGGASSEGRVEFWWSPNKVSRVTWTKGNNTTSEWHTADGRTLKSVTGEEIPGIEHRLSSAVFFSIPNAADYEDGPWRLKLVTSDDAGNQSLCVAVVSARAADAPSNGLHGVGTAYCFDPQAPVLVSTLMNHTILNSYSKVEQLQGHNVAGHIDIAYVGKKKVEADLESSTVIQVDDAAFTPSPDAKAPVTTTVTVPVTVIH